MSAVCPANHQRHKIKSEFTTSLLEGCIICGRTEFLFICFLISIDLFVVVAFCFKPFHFSMLFSVDSTIYFFIIADIFSYLPFLYSCVSFLGVLMLLLCTPLGFARLFTIVGDLVSFC